MGAVARSLVGPNDGRTGTGGTDDELVARVRDGFGVELPLRSLFEAQTVRDLAGRIEELRRQQQGVLLPPLVAQPRGAKSPPSYAQERLWFLDQLEPLGSAYNMPMAMRLEGCLDATALERSLAALVERHESLRTRFEMVEGACLQVVDEPDGFVRIFGSSPNRRTSGTYAKQQNGAQQRS